jgi:acyl-CoA synthetase (AMP-forming)/AMP-acid ligase II
MIEATVPERLRDLARRTSEIARDSGAPRLADFKQRRCWEFVDALPRSTMGKVLKRELAERYAQQPAEVVS